MSLSQQTVSLYIVEESNILNLHHGTLQQLAFESKEMERHLRFE
jgi:hypothetical protein